MGEQLRKQYTIKKELLHQENAKINNENISSCSEPGNKLIKNFKTGDGVSLYRHELPANRGKTKLKNNLAVCGSDDGGLRRELSNCAEYTSGNHTDENDKSFSDGDVKDVVEKLRNGCDKTFFDQNEDISIISYQLGNSNVNLTSPEDVFKENVPGISEVNSTDSINLATSKFKTSCTNILKTPVIPFSSRDIGITKESDIEISGTEDPIEEQTFSQELDETLNGICIRGKNNIKFVSYNFNTNAVSVPSTNKYTATVKKQTPLKYACQSPCKSLLPLHACNTFSHLHVSHHHIYHYQHHINKFESENFANELTNALSSRIPFLINNNISHCTKSALKRQSKRQSSFLKSQSLDIVQDAPTILSNHQVIVDDKQLFFQLSENSLDEIQHNQQTNSSKHTKEHRQSGPKLSSFDVESITKTKAGSAITRSLSLSSQKNIAPFKTQSLDSRPIYPNVPYSPYASPYSSPRCNRRKPPLRESRRVSIEQSGSFLQLNQYKLMDQIGQGSYGLVKLAYSEEDSTHYAMKILSKRRLLRQAGLMKRGPKKNTSPLDRVYREIAVLKKLDHPNVVKLVEVLDDPMEDSLYMVLELVKQGEVLSVPTKNPLTEERAWSVFRDTLLGLEYLHYQRIVHSDIKPGNLLLTECGRVKIADLGVCNEFIGEDATMTTSTAGTPAFRAPETLNVGQNIYCGKAADVWALGATLFALVFGNVPFVASSIPVLYEKIKKEKLYIPETPGISVELKDCIQKMLKKSPADRITVPQLKEHVWVVAGGLHPLPSEEENCRLVQVNDEDIYSVVRSIPKLDTLILIKTMLKNHSFGNPFSRGVSGREPQRGGSRLERFIRAGRSNSAPGSYNIILDRQLSGENILPALCEHSPLNSTNNEPR